MITDERLAELIIELEQHIEHVANTGQDVYLLFEHDALTALREVQARRFTDAIIRGDFEYKPPCQPAS